MPAYTTSTKFDKLFAKLSKKDADAIEQVGDALDKFSLDPVPNGLHFKPIPGAKNIYSIRIPMRKGWRILFRKITLNGAVVYEAFKVGDHDMRRDAD